jgi:hypothetical protein
MGQRTILGCLAAFCILGCLLPAGAICATGNIGAYYLLRKTVTIRDPSRIENEMDRIESEVRSLRGIPDASPVKRTLITPDQLRAQMTDEFQKTYSRQQAQDDVEEYAAFGVLNPKFDLFSFYLNTYSAFVLGYYDPAMTQLFVVSGAGFGPSERATFAHEYMHGLQFQTENLSPENWSSGENSDIVSGIQALVEGEATFVEDMWQKRYFSLGDEIDYYKESLGALNLDYFRIPYFLEQQLYFPYYEGRAFVAYLYAEGGWAAVDAAYRNPPVSAEMILHPAEYLRGDRPISVAKPVLPATLPEGWHEIRDDVLGEFSIDLILATRMNTMQASQAAAGWGGDHLLVLRNEAAGSTAVVWHTRWDTQADADDFASALQAYDGVRFGDSKPGTGAACWTASVTACQAQTGTDVWWFYGPDRETVQSLIKSNLPQETGFDPILSPTPFHFLPGIF